MAENLSEYSITKQLNGKRVNYAGFDGEYLIIVTMDGYEIKIGWRSEGPYFAGKNVTVKCPVPKANGVPASHIIVQ